MSTHQTNPSTPDLTSYRTVHAAIRRAPHRMSAAVLTIDVADRGRIDAFARYWRGFAAEVLSHHTIEDDIFFPRLVHLIPSARAHIDRTDSEHHQLDELMERCALAVIDLQRDAGRPVRERVAESLDALARHMDGHLDFEDEVILPLFAELVSVEEYTAMEEQAKKSVRIGAQAAFAVPFIVDAAGEATRQQLFASAPLALRVLYRATRRRHERLTALALGDVARLDADRVAVAS